MLLLLPRDFDYQLKQQKVLIRKQGPKQLKELIS